MIFNNIKFSVVVLFLITCFSISGCGRKIVDPSYTLVTILENKLNASVSVQYFSGKEVFYQKDVPANDTAMFIETGLDDPVSAILIKSDSIKIKMSQFSKIDRSCTKLSGNESIICNNDQVSVYKDNNYIKNNISKVKIELKYTIDQDDLNEMKQE